MAVLHPKQFLTPKDVAKILQLNVLTIYSYIRKNYLQAIKFGRTYRVEKKSLDAFIDENKTK